MCPILGCAAQACLLALPPYFRIKTWWWPHSAETCSLLHPLLINFFRYCCVIDWYPHLLFIYRHKYNSIPYFIHTLNNAIPTIIVNNAKLYWTLQRHRDSQKVEVDSNITLRTPSHQATVRSQLRICPTTIRIVRNYLAFVQPAKMLSTLLSS